MCRCIGVSLIIVLAAVAAASGATIHVKADGSGDVATILDAVNAASTGDTVMLADGTYAGTGNRDVEIWNSIVVQSESGSRELCIIDCDGTSEDNHYGFDLKFVGSPGPVIEGLTIREGYWGTGGAIHVYPSGPGTSIPTIRDCVFAENICSSWGGAIAASTGSSPSISQCLFVSNSSQSLGGAVALYDGSSCTLSDCEFSLSQAGIKGGAVWGRAARATLTECLFDGNMTGNGGGAVYAEACTLSFDGCDFFSNSTNYGPAGVFLSGGSLEMTDCTTCANRGGSAGAAWFGPEATTATILGCSFVADSAGVAVIYNDGSASLALENTVIAFGKGCQAVYCSGSPPPTAVCCDVYGNQTGNWISCLTELDAVNGNLSADPLFCDLPTHDLTLEGCSPCLAANNTCGVDIGARGSGCGCGEATEPATWGAIKTLFK